MSMILGFKDIEKRPYISSSIKPPRNLHSHEFFELSFCVTGQAVNTINGVPCTFHNGSCVILRPGDVHSLTGYDPRIYEHIDLYASTERFKTICDAAHPELYEEIVTAKSPIYFQLSSELFTVLFNQSLLLKEMSANDNHFHQTLYVSMIFAILSEWARDKFYTKSVLPDWLKELLPKFNDIAFAQKNVTQIANETGFSLPYFSTQFKKYLGVSASEYLTKKRMHLSKDLLANPHLRILDVSAMLGFENPSTFSKHFMQEFKLTPKEYRKLDTDVLST